MALVVVVAGAALAVTASAASPPSPGVQSRYLTMSDGTRIAIDLVLPDVARKGLRVPTVFDATRYGRRSHPEAAAPYVSRGYAVVIADARGTGASFGTSTSPFARTEIRDDARIVEWITRQRWSNGRVGAYGISYDAGTAELTAARRPRGLVAVAPTYFTDDPYGDVIYPGGILNRRFVAWWSATVSRMDQGAAATPVDGPAAAQLARAAVAEHARNMNVLAAALHAPRRTDAFGATTYAAISSSSYRRELRAARIPYLVITGWFDGADVRGALRRYNSLPNRQLVVIGPWNHGGSQDANPFRRPGVPPSLDDAPDVVASFFDTNLTMATPLPQERVIRYFTLGENRWHQTPVWPPRTVRTRRLHLGPSRTLLAVTSAPGTDRYRVDMNSTTGLHNRWFLTGGDVVHPDRRRADRRLLTYTSAPLRHEVTVTGTVALSFGLATSTQSAAVFAYLEDVAPNGRVTYITEGEQRVAVTPQRRTQLSLALIPTSVTFPAGHHIRIALAGSDRDTFARVPSRGMPTFTIYRGRSSFIDLPVDGRRA
jgi:putative CocE/NonD family hydrolase